MTLSRRDILKVALANAILAPLPALGAGPDVSRIEYAGADNPADYRRFLEEQSRDAVVVSVFHADWCGPCKELFKQLDAIKKQPGIRIKIVGVDVGPPAFTNGPYKNIVKAHKVMGTPTYEILARVDTQHKMVGYIQNMADMTRYLQDLTRAVHGDVSVPAPRP